MIRAQLRRLLALGALVIVATSIISGWAAVNTVPVSHAGDQVFAIDLGPALPAECAHLTIENTVFHPAAPSGGNNLIFGTEGDDVINGTGGDDCIVGLGGNDTLDGSGGSDVLIGGAGNDTLRGSGGADRLYGEDDDDTLNGGGGNDLCNGGLGTDSGSSCETSSAIP